MKINPVLDYYYRAYNKAAQGKEGARSAINAFKKSVSATQQPARYQFWKKRLMRLVAGPFYWTNTFPTAIDEAAAGLLYCLTKLARPAVVVEVGTAYGNSAIAIAQALEENNMGMLYTIDPEEQEIVNIAIKKSGLGHRIRYHIGYSYDVVPAEGLNEIDMAFIDGDHFGDNPMNDFDLLDERIVKGGILVFHDAILFDAVKKAIAKLKASGRYEVITLPTLSGAGGDAKGALVGTTEQFTPAGLAIARKL